MSGAVAAAPRPIAPRAAIQDRGATLAPWLRLAAFAGLAGYAAAYWASFVASPPSGRIFWVLAIAVGLGAALIGMNRVPLPLWAVRAGAAALTLIALAAALVAIGLPAEMLKPARWDNFASLLDRGVSGLRMVTWPYGGDDPVVKLVVLLAIPPTLIAAAALAFWPVRRWPRSEPVALVLLVGMYAVAITDQAFGGELGRGLLLLVLIAAWLWLPSLGRRTAIAGAAAVAGAALVALPIAAAFDAERSWIDYQSWAIGGKPHAAERFDWNHQYGPISWPRSGRTLLLVRSAKPHYWKAETLEYFDGLRWAHTTNNERLPVGGELPPTPDGRWDERIGFTVRQLRSDLLIGAGTVFSVDGDVGANVESGGGTVRLLDQPIREGDTYTVRAYVPDPSADQMLAAPERWNEFLRGYISFSLPRAGETAVNTPPRTDADRGRDRGMGNTEVALPFRGEVEDPISRATREQILASPYGRMYRLARRLASNQATAYDVVRNTERWLQSSLQYSERVPTRPYPLPAFLFQDKVGYCQQFSGAMALMLRMNGIPARVAGGFAPGIYEQSTKEYRVRDLDAHSWVEVYFTGIGWVPFDPTPTLAPAGSQSSPDGGASAATGGRDRSVSLEGRRQNEPSSLGGGGDLGASSSSIGLWVLPLAIFGLLLAGGGALVAYSWRHERRNACDHPGDAQLAELRAALVRMGHDVPPRTTLRGLEQRLGKLVGPAAARYARLLRERRFGPAGADGPGRAERIALRRELAATGGRLGRIRALLALPPRRRAAN